MLLNATLPIGWQGIVQGMSDKERAEWIALKLGTDMLGIGTASYGKAKKKKTKWRSPNK